MDKKDLYNVGISRKQAYLLYLSTGTADDLSVLPTPLTDAEIALYELCTAKEYPLSGLSERISALEEAATATATDTEGTGEEATTTTTDTTADTDNTGE